MKNNRYRMIAIAIIKKKIDEDLVVILVVIV
jgi:hypothetical protein